MPERSEPIVLSSSMTREEYSRLLPAGQLGGAPTRGRQLLSWLIMGGAIVAIGWFARSEIGIAGAFVLSGFATVVIVGGTAVSAAQARRGRADQDVALAMTGTVTLERLGVHAVRGGIDQWFKWSAIEGAVFADGVAGLRLRGGGLIPFLLPEDPAVFEQLRTLIAAQVPGP